MALLALTPSFARARGHASSVACSIPEPSLDHEAEPDGGIDLGEIYSRELGGSTDSETESETDSDTDSDSDSESDTDSESEESSPSVSATFEPVVQLDWESARQVTNLTPHPRSSGRTLRFGDYRDGFYVAHSRSLSFGLGGQVSFSFGNSTFLGGAAWASVGLLPVVGRETYSYRYVKARSEALARPSIPPLEQALRHLDSLSDGDMLSYDTQGGIVFWGGLGAGQLGLTLAALARGEFQVQLEKVGADTVHVNVTGSRVGSLALQSGAGLVSVSASAYTRYARSLGFLLRYREPLAARAFDDLVRGNIAPVQKLAAAGHRSVRFHDTTTAARAGRSRQLFVGLPWLLNFSYGRDRFTELRRTHAFACGRRLDATYGAWFRRRSFRAFGHEEQDLRAFYGASYAIRGKRAIARGFFGELVLKYSAEKAPGSRLSRAMEKLAALTGLGREVALGVPQEAGRLPYSSLTLRARFGAGQTRSILAGASRLPATSPHFLQMREAAAKVAAALRRGDERGATEAYALFGRAMLSGPEAFRAGWRLAGRGTRVDYTVEGSDFSLYTATLQVKDGSGALEPSARPPLYRRRARR